MKRLHEYDHFDSDKELVPFVNCENSTSELQIIPMEPPSRGGLKSIRRKGKNAELRTSFILSACHAFFVSHI
jgi:hypothetical protein